MSHRATSLGEPPVPNVEVVVDGDFDLTAAPEVGAVLDAAIALRPAELLLDLSDCTFLDAAGIGTLVRAHHRVRAHGGCLVLRSPSPPARRVMHLVGIDRVLPIRDVVVAARGTRRRAGQRRQIRPSRSASPAAVVGGTVSAAMSSAAANR